MLILLDQRVNDPDKDQLDHGKTKQDPRHKLTLTHIPDKEKRVQSKPHVANKQKDGFSGLAIPLTINFKMHSNVNKERNTQRLNS